jgi:hypothetical protein
MRSRHFWHSCYSAFGPQLEYAGHVGRRWARAAERQEERLARGLRFEHRGGESDDFFGAGLGVRRPLRFLAWRLDLTEEQTSSLARILERLKLERAKVSSPRRRPKRPPSSAPAPRGVRRKRWRRRSPSCTRCSSPSSAARWRS